MRRFALVCCALLLMHGLLAANRTASAATISSISYDITGGDFGSLFAPAYTGPITGVSVTYTPPGGSVSTPFACTNPGACGRLDFVQTGPSVTPLAYTMFYVSVDTVLINPTKFSAKYAYFYGDPYYYFMYWKVAATAGVGAAHTGLYTYVTAMAATYIIGNEVRLPEPSTNVGLASGLLLLGALAARRTRKRARL